MLRGRRGSRNDAGTLAVGTGAHARAGTVRRGHGARADGREGARAQGRRRRHRHRGRTTPSRRSATANDFTRRRGRRRRPTSTPAKLEGYQALVFLNVARRRARLRPVRRRCRASSRTARASSASAPPRPVEPGSSFVNGLIGARPTQQPDDAVAADRRPRRPRAPVDARPAAAVEPQRPLVHVADAPDRHGPHRRALPRAERGGRRRHDTSAAPTTRSRGAATTAAAAPSTPAWAAPRPPTPRPTSASTCSARSQWTAGLVRGDCKATINANYRGTKLDQRRPDGHRPRHQRRVARPLDRRQRLGPLHRPRRLPHRRRARRACSACRRSAASSTTPTRTSASAAASVHIFDPAQYTGAENSGVTRAGTLAVYGDGGQGGERTNEDNHKMEYGLLGIVADPDFSENGYVYLQYFPTFNPQTLAARPADRAADLEDVASRASRASRSTCRPSSST